MRARERVEQTYDNLVTAPEDPTDDDGWEKYSFENAMILGKLSALRWVVGEEWDELHT